MIETNLRVLQITMLLLLLLLLLLMVVVRIVAHTPIKLFYCSDLIAIRYRFQNYNENVEVTNQYKINLELSLHKHIFSSTQLLI